MRTVGKCNYCGDPIYDLRAITKIEGKGKYHKGCYKIELDEIEKTYRKLNEGTSTT